MQANKVRDTEKFTRGGDPYRKLNIGATQREPIGTQSYRNTAAKPLNTRTYSEYLEEQRWLMEDFFIVLRNDIETATGQVMFLPFPKWLGSINTEIRNIQSSLTNLQGIVDTYTFSGTRLEED